MRGGTPHLVGPFGPSISDDFLSDTACTAVTCRVYVEHMSQVNVPPDKQRHAAGYMTSAESRSHMANLHQRQADGEALGGDEDPRGKPGPGNPRGGPYQDGRPGDHRFQPRVLNSQVCGYPGCNSPKSMHDDSGSGSGEGEDPNGEPDDEHGPRGNKPPRAQDLPSYTIWGHLLRRAGKR